ncbi:ran-binding protein 16 isoform X2 [Contarinia nasturtii]|uniref:ran-binding protein 16 isoform X2 n=1 Tax=Contarinia nasturtii TaxID=265458 RepID=UPI0012D3F2E8|nr:ran-binding protein 16 isoform X2 [Contarinia nasturtii]
MDNTMQEVIQLELMCKQMYEGENSTRNEAEKVLVAFQNSLDALPKCQLLLDRGQSSYSQLLAATTLTKLIAKNAQGLSLQEIVDIRNYILNYLATRPNLESFVIQALVTVLAKITKYGWFYCHKDEMVFRNIIEDVRKFLQGSVEHCMIGVQILSQLTCEMNHPEVDVNISYIKHRKTVYSFRDTQLYDIYILSCTLLMTARDNCKTLNFMDEKQHGLINQILRLTKNCLSYDFIGTSNDETTDDSSTIQIPTNWRPAFLDLNYLNLFFDLYHLLPSRLSSLALSTLVQITSVRRSLFSNTERAKFLSNLVVNIKNILENSQGLSDPDNYHEFCRLLARLKTNYQLSELVVVECYPEVIQLIAKFTIQSLQMWQFAPNSIHYLLSLWQRMVASIPYVRAVEPHHLDAYTPEVTKAYITSRLDSARVIIRDGLEDPLDDLAMVQQQLDQLSVIIRCEYDQTCNFVIHTFDQTASEYQELLNNPVNNSEIAVREAQLTWLVYIIGAAIGGRLTFTANDEHDILDGDLVVRVLQLMRLTDSRLPQCGCEKLELSMISFLDHIRKIYIIEQMQKMKIYKRLSELLGINDEPMLLSVINRKIITNLKFWGHSEVIIRKTLNLLNELSVSYSWVRKLVKLEEIQFLLNNHTSEHFSFLGSNVAIAEMRCRSMFYTSLGRLLMVDLGEDEERFYNFMSPLTNQFESIGSAIMDTSTYPSEEAKKALIGLSRDLRGLTFSSSKKNAYMMFFDWIYPDYTPILIRAIELWPTDPQVTTPILKLFAELVQNRSQRLQFDISSPNGILLFREASKVICTYGNRIMNYDVPKNQLYALRLKGISICFTMLKAALSGNYVNFGVCKLYGDETLDNVLDVTTKLILTIPQTDLLVYPKLSQSYFLLLECLAQDHMAFLSTLDPAIFLYIIKSISEGLAAEDTTICTGCCSILDNIVSHIFKQLSIKAFPTKKMRRNVVNPDSDMFLKVIEMHPEILQGILSTIINIVMFEDCKNQWSLSRPLLGLILLYEDYFRSMKENIIRSQPLDKQQTIAHWFDNLMENVERNLSMKNRDKFSQNLSLFRRDVNETLKQANINSSNSTSGGSGGSSINDMIVS